MRIIAAILAFALLACPSLALAQQQDTALQQQMSEEEFKAAGLHKLSADELAALNKWLGRMVEERTRSAVSEAREEGRKEVVRENRGFFDFGSSEPIVAHLQGEFTGFGKGLQYKLDNGQVWEQTDDARLAGVRRSNPKVTVKPGVLGVWWMQIDGYNTAAKVRRIK
ncbi:MAG: hypothetical protein QM612_11940 [Thermomonas sp.]|uniref:hypothetical protein n=1 Tax=Thermomonas sp. TaxID=1971895 RepID=UPI0039E55B2B